MYGDECTVEVDLGCVGSMPVDVSARLKTGHEDMIVFNTDDLLNLLVCIMGRYCTSVKELIEYHANISYSSYGNAGKVTKCFGVIEVSIQMIIT